MLASYDPEEDRYTIHAGSGGAVRQKRELAEVLGVEPDQVIERDDEDTIDQQR